MKLVVLICALVVVAACARHERPHEPRTHADSVADSIRQDSLSSDSTARADRDPPCFASHFGLPCR